MGAVEIEAFLTHLAKDERVSSSTQNQALNALLFLYRSVLQMDLPVPLHALRAKRSEHLPAVLSKDEVARVLSGMRGLNQLMAKLLYGCGLRLMESSKLRRARRYTKKTSKGRTHDPGIRFLATNRMGKG